MRTTHLKTAGNTRTNICSDRSAKPPRSHHVLVFYSIMNLYLNTNTRNSILSHFPVITNSLSRLSRKPLLGTYWFNFGTQKLK